MCRDNPEFLVLSTPDGQCKAAISEEDYAPNNLDRVFASYET